MKLKQLTRITTLVLVLLLCMSMTLQTAEAYYDSSCETQPTEERYLEDNPDAIREKPGESGPLLELDPNWPVFTLIFERGDESIATTAFYVQDTHGNGNTYLITAHTDLVTAGYDTVLIKKGYEEKASYICSKGSFAFFYAPGLEEMQPLQIASQFTDLLAALLLDTDENGELYLACDYFDIGSWIDYGTYYLSPGNTLGSTLYLGAPCMEFATYRIAGLITTKNEGEIAVQSLLDLIFLPEAALFDAEGKALYKPDTLIEGVSPIVYVAVGAVVLLVIFVLTRKSKSPASVPVESGSYGHTVSLDRGAGVQPIAPISPIQPIATANYQIRAIGGQMDGQVKLLNASLRFGRSSRCDVAFPQNAPGISGEHCEVSMEGGRVVLRDLGSSYGTYLNKYTKLEPRIAYTLQMGDTFTLAEGGQSFRLEKAGASFSGGSIAVRRVDTGESFQSDISGQITFGREMRNAVTFAADSGVSNNHCVLYKEGDLLYLKDVGSTNGTFFAEDKRLKPNHPYKVKKGVSFFLVSRKFTFTITEE